jgi:hypothetical protein
VVNKEIINILGDSHHLTKSEGRRGKLDILAFILNLD